MFHKWRMHSCQSVRLNYDWYIYIIIAYGSAISCMCQLMCTVLVCQRVIPVHIPHTRCIMVYCVSSWQDKRSSQAVMSSACSGKPSSRIYIIPHNNLLGLKLKRERHISCRLLSRYHEGANHNPDGSWVPVRVDQVWILRSAVWRNDTCKAPVNRSTDRLNGRSNVINATAIYGN
jgi:hypothetical protein